MRNILIAGALIGAVGAAYVALPSKGECKGTCSGGTCPVGTVSYDESNCKCSGVNQKQCGCGGVTKCYDSQGRLLASPVCSGQCEWRK